MKSTVERSGKDGRDSTVFVSCFALFLALEHTCCLCGLYIPDMTHFSSIEPAAYKYMILSPCP